MEAAASIMATPSKGTDRRAQRTRQMLRQAFREVAQEKGVMTASIQDIAERADVSRGAFYAHYADKYALIDAIIREDFQHQVSSCFLPSPKTRETLYLLIKLTLEYIKRIYQRHHLSNEMAVLVERVLHEELYGLIFTWLKERKSKGGRSSAPLETLAQVISWAIFGAAVQWSQETTTISKEQMVQDVLLALMDGGSLPCDESSPEE